MIKGKTHLTLSERKQIELGLEERRSLGQIARSLGKSTSTVLREIRKHTARVQSGAFGRPFNCCLHRKKCDHRNLCDLNPACSRKCSLCKLCCSVCPDFEEERCTLLDSSPHVCNGCKQRRFCTLEKSFYKALDAQDEYEDLLHVARQGFNFSGEELLAIDELVSPLIRQGQSVGAIVRTQKDFLMCSEATVRRLVDAGVLSARNIDMPLKCRLKPRKGEKKELKIDRNCLSGRSYSDYLHFISEHPDVPVVQIDSVLGAKGGKVLLTMLLTNCNFMLAFLRERNTAASVTECFNWLEETLGGKRFRAMFSVLLTDNGSEFSNPLAIETRGDGTPRTRIFYCEPSAPYEKGKVENNHTLLRRILPKGSSFDRLTQKEVDLVMSHLNSYSRASLNGRSPAQMFVSLYGEEVLHFLRQEIIPDTKIIMNPKLLKK